MLTDKKLSVIVPCFNDEGNIQELISRLKSVLKKTTRNWEIIYINDSSPDNSMPILEKIAEKDKRIKVLLFSRNFGVMSVFRAGLDYSSGDAVVLMDGDLQDPPEVVPRFVEKWIEGYLVVFGKRESRDETLLRRIGYYCFYPIWRYLTDFDIPVKTGEFALIDRQIVEVIKRFDERTLFLRGIRSWVGFPQTAVSYHRPSRYSGNSTQTYVSYFNWAIKAITSFSIAPLKFITLLSVSSFIGLLFLICLKVWIYLQGAVAPPGFFTLLFVMSGIGVVQLLALAIIAEYIIHIMIEVKKRPQYIVQKKINVGEDFPQDIHKHNVG